MNILYIYIEFIPLQFNVFLHKNTYRQNNILLKFIYTTVDFVLFYFIQIIVSWDFGSNLYTPPLDGKY
jgi:hypothetical protein